MIATLLPHKHFPQSLRRFGDHRHSFLLMLFLLLTAMVPNSGFGQLVTDNFSNGYTSPVTNKNARILTATWSGTSLYERSDGSNQGMANIGYNHYYLLTLGLEEGYQMSVTSISLRKRAGDQASFQIKINGQDYGTSFPAGDDLFPITTRTVTRSNLRNTVTIRLAVSNTTTNYQNFSHVDDFVVNGSISPYDIAGEATPDANGILYVDKGKAAPGNGSSWANAMSQVHYALKAKDTKASIKQIWVAKGEYQPSADGSSFELREDLKVYGGFNGVETALSARNVLANKTTLKGRGSSVIHNTGIGSTALLDGFYISGGSGTAISSNISYGAGMYNNDSSPVIANCVFTDNATDATKVTGRGGGIYNLNSNPTILQCIFTKNKTQGSGQRQGGGLYNYDSSPIIRNCLFTGNTAAGTSTKGNGGAMANFGTSAPVIENTIIWNNPDASISAGFSSISNTGGPADLPVVSYSLIQGGFTDGDHIIDVDPEFTNASEGNYMQKKSSPVLNAGNPSPDLSGFPKNAANEVVAINGKKRVLGTIDLGPFEVAPVTTWFVNAASTVANPDGKSWATAFPKLQSALSAAFSEDQIWVAKGQYQPASGQSFSMIEGVKMYGGFVGNETDPNQRPFRFGQSKNLEECAVLLGNDNRVIYNNDNGLTDAALLDGFTIKGGRATEGAGMLNRDVYIVIYNCAFISNTATANGGAIHNRGSNFQIQNTIFTDNEVLVGYGGAVSGINADGSFVNCLFNGNTALSSGAVSTMDDVHSFTNCTFYGNSSYDGETVYVTSYGSVFRNCIVYGNSGGIVGEYAEGSIYGSLVQNRGFNQSNQNLSGTIDPQFVDPAGGDFRLMACSPAINRGSYFDDPEDNRDLAGNVRVFNKQVDMGAFEVQQLPQAKRLPPGTASSVTLPVYAGITSIMRDCETFVFVEPIGEESGVYGDIVAKSYVNSGQTLVSGTQVFVKRHYDLTPSEAPGSARITLFFTQQEFDDYNQAYGTANGAALPANLKIVQYHGSSASGLPGTYSGSKQVITDLNVVFDNLNGIYQVSFDISGFSGFFATGQSEGALPVNLISLKAWEREGKGYLEWSTASESNSDRFEVERSSNGKSWTTIGEVRAQGDATSVARYFFLDQRPLDSENLYRLKMIDRGTDGGDGTYAYSRIVSISFTNASSPALYPNPAVDQVAILNIADSQLQKVEFYDNTGKLMPSQTGPMNGKLNVSKLPSGTYNVKFILHNNQSRQFRLVIAK